MIVTEIKHINTDGELYEGDVIKFNNADKVFFVVERTIMVPHVDENDTSFIEEYVVRKLNGNDVNALSYDEKNETKRISFPSGNAPMKVDHMFIVGKMFKSYQ